MTDKPTTNEHDEAAKAANNVAGKPGPDLVSINEPPKDQPQPASHGPSPESYAADEPPPPPPPAPKHEQHDKREEHDHGHTSGHGSIRRPTGR